MSNKKMIQKIFDEKFNSKDMKIQILKNYERKEKSMPRIIKIAVPVFLLIIVCTMFIFSKEPTKSYEHELSVESIFVNKVGKAGVARLDADIKIINEAKEETKELNDDFDIPKDLNKLDRYLIYTRETKNASYGTLNSRVSYYYNELGQRNIRIASSKTTSPIRDYWFDEKNTKKSYIGDCELTIYEYEKMYFTEFSYDGFNFDIETVDITLEELITLLTSIIE